MTRRLGLDNGFSYSLPVALLAQLKKIGLSYAIYRTGFGYGILDNPATQVANSNAVELPYAFYHWVEPGLDIPKQIEVMLKVAKQFKPSSLWIDAEQEVGHYGEGDYMTSQQLADTYRHAMEYLKSRDTGPIGLYTGPWFVRDYSPAMKAWLHLYQLWYAEYRKFKPATIDQFSAMYHALSYPTYIDLPLCGAWQFIGTLTFQGYEADYNITDDEVFYQAMFMNKDVPVVPPVPPVVPPTASVMWVDNPTGLYIRTQDNASAPKLLWVADKTEVHVVLILADGWAKLYPSGYCNSHYLTDQKPA